MKSSLIILTAFLLFACDNEKKEKQDNQMYKTTGTFERFDPSLDLILDTNVKAEIIAEGFEWSEGALWVEKENMLLFSDVPMNTIYKWTESNGKETYLKPSGYTGSEPSISKEPGSNGLTLDSDGNLVMCQHGDRRVARMDAALSHPEAKFITLADQYNGKKLNSPNDCVFNSDGELFFTDPPYGLPMQNDKDPLKEQPHNGVYKVKKDGTVILLADSITRPNGIAFFPGEKRLLVASSDPDAPNWYVWDVNGDQLTNGKIFFSAAGYDSTWHGLPDGFKIDSKGNVYATGPGGVYFFNSDGKKLGMLRLGNASSNCALSADEKTLYVTNDMYVLRIKLRN
ncbi:MAG TPA: SMP-30/gluconolactonase/LRE family protein [Chitinophagaceae bacterium]|nr:SMP-30/gluconolactonase/LRE family protein [Chitinophagaceae bacterium]HRX94430.1 SMP-30/gluconolactonase/LRE family protein [Chitinophagaceae bacterium]